PTQLPHPARNAHRSTQPTPRTNAPKENSMNRLHHATYVGLGSLLSMVSLAGVAAVTQTPFIFPSLGPTAYLLYFAPRAAASTPRASVLGHAIALVCGYLAFTVSGLID